MPLCPSGLSLFLDKWQRDQSIIATKVLVKNSDDIRFSPSGLRVSPRFPISEADSRATWKSEHVIEHLQRLNAFCLRSVRENKGAG